MDKTLEKRIDFKQPADAKCSYLWLIIALIKSCIRVHDSGTKEKCMKIVSFLTLLILACSSGFGQAIKNQIGISIWERKGKVFADSSVSFVISYDQHQRKTREWQIYRDLKGEITDTNYVDLDSLGRCIHFYGRKEHWYYQFDDFGTIVGLQIFRNNDSSIYVYHPIYNKKGKLVQNTTTFNNQNTNITSTFRHIGKTVIENQGEGMVIVIEKKNKNKQILYKKTIVNLPKEKYSETIRYKRDSKGNTKRYKKKVDGKLFKKTTHYFVKGVEKYQVEQFFNPDYKIKTSFIYEYW